MSRNFSFKSLHKIATSLRRSSSDHSINAASSLLCSGAGGRPSPVCGKTALLLSIDGTDRQTDTVPFHRRSPPGVGSVSKTELTTAYEKSTGCIVARVSSGRHNSTSVYNTTRDVATNNVFKKSLHSACQFHSCSSDSAFSPPR